MNKFVKQFFAMGSPCQIVLYCDNESEFIIIAQAIIDDIERLEIKYSRYRADSLVSTINHAAGGECFIAIDEECQALLNYADVAYKLSNGLFDITTGVLRNAWDFSAGNLIESANIDQLRERVGWQYVEVKTDKVRLQRPQMEIDFGGIVKEYAADVSVSIAKQNGIKHGLIELGGDVAIIGPMPDEKPWQIGVSKPSLPSSPLALLNASSGAVASSGDYERFIEIDGIRYSHILNPKTGWPVESFAGVSVCAEQCVVAGTVATIAMLKGIKAGIEWLDESTLPYVAIDHKGKTFRNFSHQ